MTETAVKTQNYEGLFLISQSAAVDLQGVVDHIAEILTKNGCELIAMKKWDERRLAYEIDKQKRGVYLLTYFSAPGEALEKIDRDCNLSERLMRQMITRADHLTLDQMQAADAREDLAVEAKMRAERAAEQAATGPAGATLGAPPEPVAPAPSEAPAEEAPAADAPAEESAEAEKPAEG